MNKIHLGILFSLISLLSLSSCGEKKENTSKILINEVLTLNKNNFQDDYGIHSGWIEIFNNSYGSVDIAGYIFRVSKTPGDTVMYIIPKGDIHTNIKPRQHALFWADGQPSRGTFHASCTLDSASANWIGLYDSGNKLIDQVTVPVLKADQSYARVSDAAKDWETKGDNDPARYVTPSTNNQTIEKNIKQEKFSLHDASGIGMAITAMSVVFTGLLILYISFRTLGGSIVRSKKKKPAAVNSSNKPKPGSKGQSEEICAAIAMALHEELGDVHDIESNVLTNTQTSSPWNMKHLLLRETSERK